MLPLAVLAVAAVAPDRVVEARLDQLLALHKEYGLPLPPPDAKLVYFVSDSDRIGHPARWAGKKYSAPFPGIGFSLGGRTVLGNFNESSPVDFITGIKPDPLLVDGADCEDLTLALQCHDRGWTSLAAEVYRRWRAQFLGGQDPHWKSDEEYLADVAHEHWRYRLNHDPGSPLPEVLKQLKRSLAVIDPKGEWKEQRAVLRSLELSLAPRTSKPGSDAALVDELVEVWGDYDGERVIREPRTRPRYEVAFRTDPRYRALVRRGFASVPALIDHLGDERLTRVVRRVNHFNHVYDLYHCRVKDLALDLLEELAGESFGAAGGDVRARVAASRKWFAEAEKRGEEEYAVANVLNAPHDGSVNASLFWLLGEKYPARLPEAYRELIDRHPDLAFAGWQFARAVAERPLLVAEKRKVLEYAARQDDPHHRAAGIKFLRRFDRRLADELLLAALDGLPPSPSDDEMPLVEVAAARGGRNEWQALAKAARQMDVGGRLEMLKVVADETAPESRARRIAFLAESLTDDAVRDKESDPERYEWDHVAASDFERIEVRNYAALRLAGVLGLDADPRFDGTDTAWAALRWRVQEAVARELGK